MQTSILQWSIFCILIIDIVKAHEVVKFNKDGGYIVSTGFVQMKHPSPMVLFVDDFSECIGDVRFCYKSSKPTTFLTDCEKGYCEFPIDLTRLSSPFASKTFHDNRLEFVFNEDENSCVFEAPDGVYSYQILEMPRKCKIYFANATAFPVNTVTPPTGKDELVTAYMVLWIVVGIIAFIFIIGGAFLTIYCLLIKPRIEKKRAERRRRAQAAVMPAVSTSLGDSTPLLPSRQSLSVSNEYEHHIVNVKQPMELHNLIEATPPIGASDEATKTVQQPIVEPVPDVKPPPIPDDPPTKEATEEIVIRFMSVFESVLASLERLNRIKPEILRTVEPMWDTDTRHDVSRLEKIILRSPSHIGITALEKLTAEIDVGLLANGAAYGTNKSVPQTWEYVNFRGVAASASYRLFMMTYSPEFADVTQNLKDPLIAKISIPGLYMLLLNDSFNRDFKEKLIIEMRSRASLVLNELPCEELKGSAFPMSFLAKLYAKRPDEFVYGTMSKADKHGV